MMRVIAFKLDNIPVNDGVYDFPNFDELSPNVRKPPSSPNSAPLRWRVLVERHGGGVHFDALGDEKSEQVMMLVPVGFGTAVLASFSEVVEVDEAEFSAFFDNNAQVLATPQIRDEEYLTTLFFHKALLTDRLGNSIALDAAHLAELDAEIDIALDPEKQEAGVVRNPEKLWVNFKRENKIVIAPASSQGPPTQ